MWICFRGYIAGYLPQMCGKHPTTWSSLEQYSNISVLIKWIDIRGESMMRTYIIMWKKHSYDKKKKDSTAKTSWVYLVFRRKGIYAKLRYNSCEPQKDSLEPCLKSWKYLLRTKKLKHHLKALMQRVGWLNPLIIYSFEMSMSDISIIQLSSIM